MFQKLLAESATYLFLLFLENISANGMSVTACSVWYNRCITDSNAIQLSLRTDSSEQAEDPVYNQLLLRFCVTYVVLYHFPPSL